MQFLHYSERTEATHWPVQELLGHHDVATPQIATHVTTHPRIGVRSPLD